MKSFSIHLLPTWLLGLSGIVMGAESAPGIYVPFQNLSPTIYWPDQAEYGGSTPSYFRTLQRVPVGQLRFPGTKGGAWVVPYLGKGEYTFEATLEAGTSYFNQQAMDFHETIFSLAETATIQWAGLYLTDQDCSMGVPYRYLQQYNGVEWLAKVPVPSVVDLPTGTIKLSHFAVLNEQVPYDDGGMYKDWGALWVANKTYNMGFVYGSYAPRLNGSSVGSWTDQGWGTISSRTSVSVRKSTVTWKIKIDSENHNPAFKYFVQKDWAASVSGAISVNDWEWVGSHVASMRIAEFKPEAGALHGALTLAPTMMAGFRGRVPVQFSVTSE